VARTSNARRRFLGPELRTRSGVLRTKRLLLLRIPVTPAMMEQCGFDNLALPCDHDIEGSNESLEEHPVFSRTSSASGSEKPGVKGLQDVEAEINLLVSRFTRRKAQTRERHHDPMQVDPDARVDPPKRFYRRFWFGITRRMLEESTK